MSLNSLTREILRTEIRRNVGLAQPDPIDPDTTRTAGILSSLTNFIPTEAITLYVAAVSATPALKYVFPWLNEWVLYLGFGLVVTPLLYVVFYLLRYQAFAQKLKRLGARVPPRLSLGVWFWWRLLAAIIAFACWALAVPNNPILGANPSGANQPAGEVTPDVSTNSTAGGKPAVSNKPLVAGEAAGVVAAFLALFVSTLLSPIDRLIRGFLGYPEEFLPTEEDDSAGKKEPGGGGVAPGSGAADESPDQLNKPKPPLV
jgi:hypothetical protein